MLGATGGGLRGTAPPNSLAARLQRFDLFPKSIEEAREATKGGGVVTVVGMWVIAVLVLFETYTWAFPELYSTLEVDISPPGPNGETQTPYLPVNMRMVFSAVPCNLIDVDVSDRLGLSDNSVRVDKYPLRTSRLEEALTQLPRNAKRHDVQQSFWMKLFLMAKKQKQEKEEAEASAHRPTCGSCFVDVPPGTCCNSCQELRAMLSRAGKHPDEAFGYPQCRGEGRDGCMVEGRFKVRKVRGSFHVGVGSSHAEEGGQPHHHHWDRSERAAGFNVSHYISHLSFGPEFAGRTNPLDGTGFIQKTAAEQVQYFLNAVPTEHLGVRGRVVKSYQYSATSHVTRIDVNQPSRLPGLFVKYDFDSMKILTQPKRSSLAQFLVRLCGVVGGTWVVIGLVYGGAQRVSRISKKMD